MMETDPNIVLRAKGVYKKFGRSNFVARRQLAARLGAVLSGRSAAHKKIHQGDFWSLQDINLEVRRGEVLGVIGLNGAGKSTLLRVLYGLMTPDLGEIEVNGETGALIELGAGFEASLSGRGKRVHQGGSDGPDPRGDGGAVSGNPRFLRAR